MIQYKLKKWYPSLPKDWEVGDIVAAKKTSSCYIHDKIGITSKILYSMEVENNPEFWEKVEEKNYEILSYIYSRDRTIITTKRSNGLFLNNGDPDKLGLYPEPHDHNWEIHSIRRLSDNEVFTLADIINGISHRNIKINSIESNPNCNQIMFNRLDEGIDLLDAKKSQQPLHQTNDGVDIYKGDTVYYVNDKWKIYAYTVDCYSSFIPYFSTKEKAEEWVLWNKRDINLNDVYQIMLSSCYADILDNLKEIVKSRL